VSAEADVSQDLLFKTRPSRGVEFVAQASVPAANMSVPSRSRSQLLEFIGTGFCVRSNRNGFLWSLASLRASALVPALRCHAVGPMISFQCALRTVCASASAWQGNEASANHQEPTAGAGASLLLQSLQLAVPLLSAICPSACNWKICVANLHNCDVPLVCPRRGPAYVDKR
jgi:hypothetical protein